MPSQKPKMPVKPAALPAKKTPAKAAASPAPATTVKTVKAQTIAKPETKARNSARIEVPRQARRRRAEETSRCPGRSQR